MSEYRLKIGVFIPTESAWLDPKFQGEGVVPHQPFFLSQNGDEWSFMWYKNISTSFFSFFTIHAFDGKTEGRTDSFLTARPRCMQCLQGGKNGRNNFKVSPTLKSGWDKTTFGFENRRPPYLNSTSASGFHIGPCVVSCMSFCVWLPNLVAIGERRRSYDVMSIFQVGSHIVRNILPGSGLVTALIEGS